MEFPETFRNGCVGNFLVVIYSSGFFVLAERFFLFVIFLVLLFF